MFSIGLMDEERRERFRAWLKTKFGEERGQQARALEYAASKGHSEKPLDKSYLSQVLTGKVAFGEEAAMAMARRFGLPDGAFLVDAQAESLPQPLSPLVAEYAQLVDQILREDPDPRRREFAEYMLTRAVATPPKRQAEISAIGRRLTEICLPT